MKKDEFLLETFCTNELQRDRLHQTHTQELSVPY